LINTLQRTYKRLISPFLGPRCRFYPSCSEYCAQSISRFGWFKGSWLTATRLCRCHPLAEFGVDAVPPIFLWRLHWAGTRPAPVQDESTPDAVGKPQDSDKLQDYADKVDHVDTLRSPNNPQNPNNPNNPSNRNN